jgi:phosphatidylserine/phosphatidylglycerophosphate/cardiolipin synthase-like enzyme
MVIGDRIAVAGNFNYTMPANKHNDENLFVIGSPHPEVEGITVEADPVNKSLATCATRSNAYSTWAPPSCPPSASVLVETSHHGTPTPARDEPLRAGVPPAPGAGARDPTRNGRHGIRAASRRLP